MFSNSVNQGMNLFSEDSGHGRFCRSRHPLDKQHADIMAAYEEHRNGKGVAEVDFGFLGDSLSNAEHGSITPLPASSAGRLGMPVRVDPGRIESFCANHSMTDAGFMCAAFAYTYAVFAGTDIAHFCMADNDRDLPGSERTTGMFEKSVPLSIDCADASVDEFVSKAQDALCRARSVAAKLSLELDRLLQAPAPVVFQYYPDYSSDEEVFSASRAGESYEAFPLNAETITDLDFCLFKGEDGYFLEITHSVKYHPDLLRSFTGAFGRICDQLVVCDYLGEISLCANDDLDLVGSMNDTAKSYPFDTVLDVFAHHAAKDPERPCVRSGGDALTYGEAYALSDGLAAALVDAGVRPGDAVAMRIPASVWQLIAIFGILKAGACYVPIDDSHPEAWVEEVCMSSGAVVAATLDGDRLGTVVDIPVIDVTGVGPFDSFAIAATDPTSCACILFTSGSTGKPKGVCISHRSVANLCQWHCEYMGYTMKTVSGLTQSISFVAHIEALLSPLFAGACADVVPQDMRFDVDALHEYAVSHGITALKMTTPIGRLYAEQHPDSPIETLFVGGGRLGTLGAEPRYRVVDGYGATENTAEACAVDVGDRRFAESIGSPISNTKVYVLDRHGRMLPPCAAGILHTSGAGTSMGYLDDVLSGSAFLPNIFNADEPGYERMYATGDMARILPDGTIGFIGRRDSQVKIRGNRVELGEVEASIRAMAEVRDVAVQAIDANGSKEIAAYVVLQADMAGAPEGMQDMGDAELYRLVTANVASQKPSYMVPAFVIAMDAIPLNANGKVDWRALPVPNVLSLKAAFTPAESELQQRICAAFSEVLGISFISIDDDFIRLGGDSLGAMRMLPALRDAGVTVAHILSRRTPRAIAEEARGSLMTGMNLDVYEGVTRVPLSEPQLNIYLDMHANDKTESYLIAQTISFDGRYGPVHIARALDAICAAHPILCKHIIADGEGLFLEAGDAPELQDLTSADGVAIDSFLSQPFDMGKSLARFALTEIGNEPALIAVFSHVIFDGMSSDIFERDLLAVLEGGRLESDTAYLQAAAFSEQVKDTDAFEQAARFFEEQLCEADSIAGLVDDIGGSAGWVEKTLGVDRNDILAFANESSVSISALLAAAFGYVLSRFTGDRRALFNLIDNGRDRISGAAGPIGMFVNTLPVVIDCDDCETITFVKHAASTIYGAVQHGFYPFRLLAHDYGVRADVLFQYFPFEERGTALTDVGFVAGGLAVTNGEFSMMVVDDGDALTVHVSRSARYSRATAERLSLVFERVLRGLVEGGRLSEIEVVSDEDTAFQDAINATETSLTHADILDAFAESLAKFPQNALVVYEDVSRTYSQGAAIAMRIADALAKAGIKPQDSVAVLVPRSEWYLLCVLGALAVGCTYVPLDDAYPDERLAFMLSDTSAAAVLATADTVERTKTLLASACSDAAVIGVDGLCNDVDDIRPFSYRSPDPDDTACILYTSGTTGTPKGALITRRALNNYTSWFASYAQVGPDDSMCLYRSFGFDSGNTGMFVALRCGGSLVVVPWDCRLDTSRFNDYALEHNVTICGGLPVGFIKAYLERYRFDTFRIIITGGESFGPARGIPDILHDGYGPTESLDAVCVVRMNDRIHHSSVGSFLYNVKGYVLDAELRRVPVGAVGQLYVSGHQLARGYLNRPELTARSFIANSIDGNEPGYERMYATGDMARILPDGTIGFMGRRDSQVKIRGNRVELSEVEACIRDMDSVADVTVQLVEGGGVKRLAAFVVPAKSVGDDSLRRAVTSYVAASKPSYMVPAFVVALDAIPLNVNGKVDRRALPHPDASSLPSESSLPETAEEKLLVDCVKEALNWHADTIGMDTSLDLLGLDSLTAIRLSCLYWQRAGISISAVDILRRPTIRGHAERALRDNAYRPVYTFSTHEGGKQVVFVHPGHGSAESYVPLAKLIGDRISFSCIENYNLFNPDKALVGLKSMAEQYVRYLKQHQQNGPYVLGGWSLGGNIAYEMASILRNQGQEVECVYLLDAVCDQGSADMKSDIAPSYEGDAVLFRARRSENIGEGGYERYASRLDVVNLDCGHYDLMEDEFVKVISERMLRDLLSAPSDLA